jgi:hypothetical protein
MKRPLYTIADEEFATLLDRADAAFKDKGIKYMLVGGVATQAHIINYLCKEDKKLIDFINSPDFRLQDHLRATDDIDITLNPRKNGEEYDKVAFAGKIYGVLENIVGKEGIFMSPTENHLVSLSLERKGIARPVFRLGLDDNKDSEKITSFNFYKGAADTNERWGKDIQEFENRFYFQVMDRAEDVKIPFCQNKDIILKVEKAEDLIATKLVRGREKDWNDILSLINHSESAGKPIDYEIIREMLCGADPRTEKAYIPFVEKYEDFMRLKDTLIKEST